MALIRWEPVSLHGDLNRLFNTYFDSATQGGRSSLRRWTPALDVVETETDYVLRADLPGVDEKDVKIELENRVLTVSGERKAEHEERKEGYYRVERSSGSFARRLTLPAGVDPAAVTATFDKGVLEIRIPRPALAKPHRVEISVASPAPTAAPEPVADAPTPALEPVADAA